MNGLRMDIIEKMINKIANEIAKDTMTDLVEDTLSDIASQARDFEDQVLEQLDDEMSEPMDDETYSTVLNMIRKSANGINDIFFSTLIEKLKEKIKV